MSDKENDQKNAIDNFLQIAEEEGEAVGPVTNGYVLMFKRTNLQKILDDHPDNEKIIIFVKTRVLN